MIWVFVFSWGNGNGKAKYLTFEEVCLKGGSKGNYCRETEFANIVFLWGNWEHGVWSSGFRFGTPKYKFN